MKIDNNFWVGLVLGICLIATFGFRPTAPTATGEMQKWQYKCVNISTLPLATIQQNHIDALGQEGWELCSIGYASAANSTAHGTLFFKRPVP
ncbi:MAG: hypothetical protein RLZZ519_35 [Bacteroidota bacterium]|jgi:hypothetical protein